MTTADNDKFVRFWQEINFSQLTKKYGALTTKVVNIENGMEISLG